MSPVNPSIFNAVVNQQAALQTSAQVLAHLIANASEAQTAPVPDVPQSDQAKLADALKHVEAAQADLVAFQASYLTPNAS